MSTLETVRQLANRRTLARRRAEAMGFEFTRIVVEEVSDLVITTVEFRCMCGAVEFYKTSITTLQLYCMPTRLMAEIPVCDPITAIEEHGSFSEDHLRADGFSEATIREILRRGNAFDKQESL